jgi:hypothetical protein
VDVGRHRSHPSDVRRFFVSLSLRGPLPVVVFLNVWICKPILGPRKSLPNDGPLASLAEYMS